MGVRAVLASLPPLVESRMKDELYRIYITDSLQAIASNTAKLSREGSVMTKRWYELVYVPEEEARTGEEVAADVIEKAGLKVVMG